MYKAFKINGNNIIDDCDSQEYKDYLFAGDALVNRKKHKNVAFQNQNSAAAIKSYNKVLALSPKIVFVGHDKEIKLKKD